MSLIFFLKPHPRHQPGAWVPEWGDPNDGVTDKELHTPPVTIGEDRQIEPVVLEAVKPDKLEERRISLVVRRRKQEEELILMDLI